MFDDDLVDQRLANFIEDSYQNWVEFVKYRVAEDLEPILRACESPIEKYLAVALYFYTLPSNLRSGGHCKWHSSGTPVPTPNDVPDPLLSDVYAHLFQQVEVLSGRYRLDFLLVAKPKTVAKPIFIAIECDGHDFHEKTKEQAQRDRERDRALQAAGYLVFRYTGREIYQNATACTDEIVRFLKDRSMRGDLAGDDANG
jgi:very-short-patch-repair endonuclease